MASVAGAALLGGCGGGASDSVAAIGGSAAAGAPPAAAAVVVAAVPQTDAQRLNLALNLFYAGAQFHTAAAIGAGLPAATLTGTGTAGTVIGARSAALTDPLVIAAATGLAADKQAAVAALRAQLGAGSAAMPTIDLAAFAQLSREGASVDAGAGDAGYLLAGLTLDYATPAILRGLLARMEGADTAAVLGDTLAGAIHQSALIRALLASQADADPAIAAQATALFAALAAIDGTADDGMLAAADAGSTDLFDAAGRPIPFSRPPDQALRFAFLNTSGAAGGFFPAGLNGAG